MPDLHAPNWRSNLWAWPLYATLALLPLGFLIERTWQSFPRAHCAELLAVAVAAGLVAALLKRTRRLALADGLLLMFALWLSMFVGPLPLLAIGLIVAAAVGIGSAF